MLGAHAQHHVAQEHKVEQEVLVVECLVVAAQQMHKIARVRQSTNYNRFCVMDFRVVLNLN